jgi:hypothetical protein
MQWRAMRVLALASVCAGIFAACGSTGDPSLFPNGLDDGGFDGFVVDPGQFGDSGNNTNTGTCKPLTCKDQGIECGKAGDGCGGIIDCGNTCTPPATCGGGGQPSKCGGTFGCVPKTCQQQNIGCGPAGDGCGGTIPNCGTCTLPQICGGGGVPSQCGGGPSIAPDGGQCIPRTCQGQGKNCGPMADGCGNLINCGTCTNPGEICGGGGVANVCGGATLPDGGPVCTPRTCQQANANCGWIADGCGNVIFCGQGSPDAGTGCPNGEFCGGNGPNRCGSAVSDAGPPCTGLCLQQGQCDGGTSATLTGRVWGPQGNTAGANGETPLPIPGALIYIPNAQLQPVPEGVNGGQCDQCNAQASGSPIAQTTSNPDGTFTLTNVPTGTNIPIVVQLGRWRRQTVLSNVTCGTTALPDGTIRLPRNKGEGNIPLMAISTGAVDGLECVLRKMGIEKAEFTNSAGNGRVRLYQDNGAFCGNNGGANDCSGGTNGALSAAGLYGSQAELNKFDAVIFGCVGSEQLKATADLQRVVNYGDAGGRVFATHFSYVWLVPSENPNDNNYVNPWAATATWPSPYNHHSYDPATRYLLDTSFQKGQQFAQWLNTTTVSGLANAGGLYPNTSSGLPYNPSPEISVVESRHNANAVTSPAQRWAYATNNSPNNGPGENMTLHYTFNTPWGAQPANQCGRTVFSSFHVSTGNTQNVRFPAECSTNQLTAQEKILAFMLLDLTSCITPDTGPPPTCTPLNCAQQNIMCGPAGNGCGGVIQCGNCTPPQTCGGGGTPFVCGGPTCTPTTCQAQNAQCGQIGDGCGGVLNCGNCPNGQSCGGGGAPNQCGTATCNPRTCQQANAQCGPLADGCGQLLDCGPCPQGQVCQNNQCVANPCTPRTCQQANANCGAVADGCGGILDCGNCPPGQTCGGSGIPNQCGGGIPK